jgi:predicted ATPase
MAQTLHDLINEKIGEVERDFICRWLEEFGLGIDYDVHSIGGEAYIIQIKDRSGKMVYLADMGMGANQLVILILRLAIIIHSHRMGGGGVYRPTIVIEEPEQNMHPEYQSKLATLFHEIHVKYGFNFIVETHSEYWVRRSQVIVAQKKYKNEEELKTLNPFKVYYFPSDGLPYEMLYRKDGNFSNEFGKGFYDEANNLLFEII